MKTLVGIITICSFLGCFEPNQNNVNEPNKTLLRNRCKNEVNYGSKKICLPEMGNMIECYSNQRIKEKIDLFNLESNIVLGIYLKENEYKVIASGVDINFNNYYVIYALKAAQERKSDLKDLEVVASMMTGSIKEEDWIGVKSKIESRYGSFSFGQPLLLYTYSPENNVRSAISLVKYLIGESTSSMVIVANSALINDRIIWITCNYIYDGIESVEKAKKDNDNFIKLLNEFN